MEGTLTAIAFNTFRRVPLPSASLYYTSRLILLFRRRERFEAAATSTRSSLARRLHGKRSSPKGELEEGERANFRSGGRGTEAKALDRFEAHDGVTLSVKARAWPWKRTGTSVWAAVAAESERARGGEEEMPPTKKK